eukprot:1316787-Alexandrium_andersonii.AAC.1
MGGLGAVRFANGGASRAARAPSLGAAPIAGAAAPGRAVGLGRRLAPSARRRLSLIHISEPTRLALI